MGISDMVYEQMLEECNRLYSEGKYAELVDVAGEAVKRNRLNLHANYYLAEACAKTGEWLNAYTYYSRLFYLQEYTKKQIVAENDLMEAIDYCMDHAIAYSSGMDENERKDYLEKLRQVNSADNDLLNNIFLSSEELDNFFGEHTFEGERCYIGRYADMDGSYRNPGRNNNGFTTAIEMLKVDKRTSEVDIDAVPCLLPVIVNENGSQNNITLVDDENVFSFTEAISNSFKYYRLDKPIKIKSEKEMICAKPICLKHNSENKRLVVNLFLDSFNWKVVKKDIKELMPNTYKFFSKGVICNHFYSGSEFTYPSIATYWSSLRTEKHHMIDPGIHFPISKDTKLFSELFNEKGYLTAKIGGNYAVVPNYGYARGIDRFLYQNFMQKYKVGTVINETIEHIEAFKETDQFLWVDLPDLHDVAGYWDMPLSVQTKTSVKTNVVDNIGGSSLYQTYSPNRHEVYKQQLIHMDMYMQPLYEYIEKNFSYDEVIVALFSDHGNGFNVSSEQPFLSDQRMNVPLMIYGSTENNGICEEIIESVDYAHIICKLAGIKDEWNDNDGSLPSYFGGKEKEYAISQSLFPNRNYEAAIFGRDYKFYLKSKYLVGRDGRVSLEDCSCTTVDTEDNPVDNASLCEKCITIVKDVLGDYLIK